MREENRRVKMQRDQLEKDVVGLTLEKVCDRTAFTLEIEKFKSKSMVNRITMDTMAMRLTKGSLDSYSASEINESVFTTPYSKKSTNNIKKIRDPRYFNKSSSIKNFEETQDSLLFRMDKEAECFAKLIKKLKSQLKNFQRKNEEYPLDRMMEELSITSKRLHSMIQVYRKKREEKIIFEKSSSNYYYNNSNTCKNSTNAKEMTYNESLDKKSKFNTGSRFFFRKADESSYSSLHYDNRSKSRKKMFKGVISEKKEGGKKIRSLLPKRGLKGFDIAGKSRRSGNEGSVDIVSIKREIISRSRTPERSKRSKSGVRDMTPRSKRSRRRENLIKISSYLTICFSTQRLNRKGETNKKKPRNWPLIKLDSKTAKEVFNHTQYNFTGVFDPRDSLDDIFGKIDGKLDKFFERKNVAMITYSPSSNEKKVFFQGKQDDPGILPRTTKKIMRRFKEFKRSKSSEDNVEYLLACKFLDFKYDSSTINDIIHESKVWNTKHKDKGENDFLAISVSNSDDLNKVLMESYKFLLKARHRTHHVVIIFTLEKRFLMTRKKETLSNLYIVDLVSITSSFKALQSQKSKSKKKLPNFLRSLEPIFGQDCAQNLRTILPVRKPLELILFLNISEQKELYGMNNDYLKIGEKMLSKDCSEITPRKSKSRTPNRKRVKKNKSIDRLMSNAFKSFR